MQIYYLSSVNSEIVSQKISIAHIMYGEQFISLNICKKIYLMSKCECIHIYVIKKTSVQDFFLIYFYILLHRNLISI